MRTSQDDKSKEKGKKKIKFIQIHQNSGGTVPKRTHGYVPRPKYGYKISILLESIWELSGDTIWAVLSGVFAFFLIALTIVFDLWLYIAVGAMIIAAAYEGTKSVKRYSTDVKSLYYKKLKEKNKLIEK